MDVHIVDCASKQQCAGGHGGAVVHLRRLFVTYMRCKRHCSVRAESCADLSGSGAHLMTVSHARTLTMFNAASKYLGPSETHVVHRDKLLHVSSAAMLTCKECAFVPLACTLMPSTVCTSIHDKVLVEIVAWHTSSYCLVCIGDHVRGRARTCDWCSMYLVCRFSGACDRRVPGTVALHVSI